MSTAGFGLLEGHEADTQFWPDPDESRNAMFAIIRCDGGAQALGHSFTDNTTIAELRNAGGSVESVKQYSLNFPHLADHGRQEPGYVAVKA